MALLDSTPPSPQLQKAESRPPSMGSLAGSPQGPNPQDPTGMLMPDIGGILQLGQSVDESLLLLAQAVPAGARELSQARELVKMAVANAVALGGQTGTGVDPGLQFPGSPVGKGEP